MSSAAWDDNTVYPTHQCFDDVPRYLERLVDGGATIHDLERYTIVHAICLHEDDGRPYAHAWLELGDKVIFAGILRGELVYLHTARAEYVAKAFVWDETRYTIFEAYRVEKRTGFRGGPWKAEYRALCPDVQRGEAPLEQVHPSPGKGEHERDRASKEEQAPDLGDLGIRGERVREDAGDGDDHGNESVHGDPLSTGSTVSPERR